MGLYRDYRSSLKNLSNSFGFAGVCVLGLSLYSVRPTDAEEGWLTRQSIQVQLQTF